jgi:hypothetical protein
MHSSDILPIWFKHTRIIRFFWAFKKILENTWYKGQFSSLCIIIMFFLNTWKYFFLSTFEKYSYFVCHYYETMVTSKVVFERENVQFTLNVYKWICSKLSQGKIKSCSHTNSLAWTCYI